MSLRVYLTGRICLEGTDVTVDEQALPGRQGRLLLAYLVVERHRPVLREELVEVLWPAGGPEARDSAVSALVSKLRQKLGEADAGAGIESLGQSGGYTLAVPADTWIDVERAVLAVDEAEAAIRSGDPRAGWGPANVAAAIARRPLLPGVDVPWAARHRARVQAVLVRALDCLSQACTATGELALAAAVAEESVRLEPYREAGYRQLMAVHAAGGNNAEALRVFERCRRLLATELGVDPSPQTQAAHRALLR